MPRGVSLTLTDSAAVGLFFIQRYRFLTIDQFARVVDLNRSTAADQPWAKPEAALVCGKCMAPMEAQDTSDVPT